MSEKKFRFSRNYANGCTTVAILSEELDNLQKSICHDCKMKFVPSYAQVGPSNSLPCGILSDPKIPSPLSTTNPQGSPNTSIPIHPITAISQPPQLSSSSSPRQPETIPVDEIQSKQPGWSVFHNPDIKQALHIDLVKTFSFIAKVYCVNFSPDGKYLAVGLEKSGKTYIYDVEKGLCLWLAPLLQSRQMLSADFYTQFPRRSVFEEPTNSLVCTIQPRQ